ncbi:sulfotransferase [Geobacillus thermocatenulatus]|uniref:sulfotransferase n=1 Tax=Geobacillus thermocatenulatus TaxID=33938 RepID=UPI00094B5508|nr:sulfotransferase [Geobacillus thermocatenulatus]
MIKYKNNPILVTGAHRSGTTFVGKMLSLHPSIGYIQEPFNKDFGVKGIENWFLYTVDEQIR